MTQGRSDGLPGRRVPQTHALVRPRRRAAGPLGIEGDAEDSGQVRQGRPARFAGIRVPGLRGARVAGEKRLAVRAEGGV